MHAREGNQNVFRFLRGRQAFVASQENESIDGFVIWGAATDALARIHAARTGASTKGNRKCFVRALLELAPGHALGTVSLPLLHHDVRVRVLPSKGQPAAADHDAFVAARQAGHDARVWATSGDLAGASQLADLRSRFPAAAKLIDQNSYAEILYESYRCCAVHALELGWKTCRPFHAEPRPHYSNYIYGDDDPRPAERRYRTRIVFPLPYLAVLLAEMIDAEEIACIAANWTIPPYATLDE